MDIGDSNALLFPAKELIKKEVKTQRKGSETIKLSKSQERKLKKLAEEKKKNLLLSKSLETLERYKITEDVSTLLWSSQNIGQAETMLEKRRRNMQFSKVGLVVTGSGLRPKRRKVESCETLVDAEESSPLKLADSNSTLQAVASARADRKDASVLSVSSQGPVLRCSGYHGGFDSNKFSKSFTNEDACRSVKLVTDAGKSSSCHSLDSDREGISTVDELNGNISGMRIVQDGAHLLPVKVYRSKEVDNLREALPIIMNEQEIMEAINEHGTAIICGETGCGKTTQVPQFLYEAGYGSKECNLGRGVIGVTQPRRVAVLSTAKRVAYELGVCLGKEVGFQVRHGKNIGENGSIKFMTDGILLREIKEDFILKRYSVIILDEVHERSLNTDILIGMLSGATKERQRIYVDQQQRMRAGELIKPESRVFPLKLVLMSATLRVEDFTLQRKIFCPLPTIIDVKTRQFPVTKHFTKKTELVDYIGEAYRMVLKIHKRLPPGGILVFVTGQREVEYLCTKLRLASKKFVRKSYDVNIENETATGLDVGQIDGCSMKDIHEALDTCATSAEQKIDRCSWCHDESDDYDSSSSCDSGTESEFDNECDNEDSTEKKSSKMDTSASEILGGEAKLGCLKAAFEALMARTGSVSEGGGKEMNTMTPDVCSDKVSSTLIKDNGGEKGSVVGPLHVLPLYAMLPAAAQLRVFDEIKEGERLVVVATNVAETSLTIPGIKYVVDTGREKVKKYNSSNGMASYEIQWISKASAAQRAGRAGRTGPGHCYCLYSAAAFSNEFPEVSCPEISKVPVDGVVLFLKSMGICEVAKFPFPTPPSTSDMKEAERCLKVLEALDGKTRLTPLGKAMAQFPLSPRHSRLLLCAIKMTKEISCVRVRPNLVLSYAVAVAAALSLSNPFVFQFDGNHANTETMEQDEESGSHCSQKNENQKSKLTKKPVKRFHEQLENFSYPSSDALTVAYALQCFEQSENPAQFCDENALHLKIMVEMSKLRKQLLHLVFNQRYCDLGQDFTWTLGTIEDVEHHWRMVVSDKKRLSQIEENILCQAICAGWADRVAIRIREENRSANGDKKGISYKASMVEKTVYLRPWSSVYRSAPKFLVYHEMLHTDKPFIHGATSVQPEWLEKYARSLCTYSAPLKHPKPFYDPHCDQVFCYVTPFYGPHRWELPLCKMPIKNVRR